MELVKDDSNDEVLLSMPIEVYDQDEEDEYYDSLQGTYSPYMISYFIHNIDFDEDLDELKEYIDKHETKD